MAETSPPASPEQPKKPKKHHKKPKKPEKPEVFNDIMPELRERYPKAFTRDPKAIMPLAIGLHKELARAGYDRKALYKALKYYTNSYAYLGALAAGKPRVNLDGEPVGTVSEEHQQEAAAALAVPGGRKSIAPPDAPQAVALAGQIKHPPQKPQQKTPMPSIDLKGLQAKIAVTIDAATFRAALKVDTMGAKSVPVAIAVEGRAYMASLNAKSFRKAQAMFQEAAQPVVSISGNLKGDVIEAAGIQVFDKGGKAPQADQPAKAPPPEAAAPAVEPAKAPETEPGTPETGAGGRPKLSLKPKAG